MAQMDFIDQEIHVNGEARPYEFGYYYGGTYKGIILPVGFSDTLTEKQSLNLLKLLDNVFLLRNAYRVAENLADRKLTIKTASDAYGQEKLVKLQEVLANGLNALCEFEARNLFDLDGNLGIEKNDIESDEVVNVIKESICFIDSCLEYLTFKKEHSSALRQKARAEVSRNYNELFVKLGRVYGFHCLSCNQASSDLQIDHIKPVSQGGTSEWDNLQLLCKPCNSTKGTQTIDYRPKVGAEIAEVMHAAI